MVLHCVSGMWTLHKSYFWYFHLGSSGFIWIQIQRGFLITHNKHVLNGPIFRSVLKNQNIVVCTPLLGNKQLWIYIYPLQTCRICPLVCAKWGVAPLRELLYIVHYFHEWNEHRVTKIWLYNCILTWISKMVETARKGEATATARVHTKTMKYLKRGHFALIIF